MARPRRHDLRSKLIDAAWELFASSGYDETTIERIIDRVHVSKGAFYHYFSTKEEVLDAVLDQMMAKGMETTLPSMERTSITAGERLNAFLSATRNWRLANIDAVLAVAYVLMRDENTIIRHKLYRRIVLSMQPVLSRIIHQGVQEGIFDVADPDETAVVLLNLMNVIAEIQTRRLLESGQSPQDAVSLQERSNLYIGFIERILGAPKGTVERVKVSVFETAFKSIRSGRTSGNEGRHGTLGDS